MQTNGKKKRTQRYCKKCHQKAYVIKTYNGPLILKGNMQLVCYNCQEIRDLDHTITVSELPKKVRVANTERIKTRKLVIQTLKETLDQYQDLSKSEIMQIVHYKLGAQPPKFNNIITNILKKMVKEKKLERYKDLENMVIAKFRRTTVPL